MHVISAPLWAALTCLALLVGSTPTTPDLSPDAHKVIQQRQFDLNKKNGDVLFSRIKERQSTDDGIFVDAAAPRPSPSGGCRRQDTEDAYLVYTKDDPDACGTCPLKQIKCAASANQIPTCIEGKCGVECDSRNGYTGPSDDCTDTSTYSHVTCPKVYEVNYRLKKASYDTKQRYEGRLTCEYEPSNGSQTEWMPGSLLVCEYNTAFGIWVGEKFGDRESKYAQRCPDGVDQSTANGRFCYSKRACDPLFVDEGVSYTIDTSKSQATFSTPGSEGEGELLCHWKGSLGDWVECSYSQPTLDAYAGKAQTGGKTSSFPAEECPPVRAAYTGYCLLPPL